MLSLTFSSNVDDSLQYILKVLKDDNIFPEKNIPNTFIIITIIIHPFSRCMQGRVLRFTTPLLPVLSHINKSLFNIQTHKNGILDIAFETKGQCLATASKDCTARIWNIDSVLKSVSTMNGHTDEISKVSFSTSGDLLLTASADHTARIWLAESGSCLQVLSGHTDEVYACTFSYNQDLIITASKDNQCLFWRRYDWYTLDA